MFAEGKSKVHIHVNTKSKFKSLLQRLIVNVSQNKGWKVLFGKILLIEIPNIDHILQKSQSGCVIYTDIALDPLVQLNTGDEASKCENVSMDVDVDTNGYSVQQSSDLKSNVGSDKVDKPECSESHSDVVQEPSVLKSNVGSDKVDESKSSDSNIKSHIGSDKSRNKKLVKALEQKTAQKDSLSSSGSSVVPVVPIA